MAQTLPPAPGSSSPLPRYERKRAGGSAKAAPRPRFQAADGLLMALFCAAFLATKAAAQHTLLSLAALLLALSAGLTYLLGWRCGGRLCGIVAGSLIAFSLAFAGADASWDAAGLGLLTLAALFAFACDALPLGCALAGLAAAVRPDGLLLGLLLLAFAYARAKRQFLPCAGLFVVAAGAGAGARLFLLHLPFAAPHLGMIPNAMAWLMHPAQSLTLWLLVPFCAELTDPARRARWLPTALWAILLFADALLVHFDGTSSAALPLMPIVFVLAAGGLARLMPLLAGEVPAARYGLATLAVVGLVGLRVHTEWPRALPAQAAPVPAVPIPAAPLAQSALPPKTASMPQPKLPNVARGVLIGRALLQQPIAIKAAPKPAVPLFVLQNGRRVRRSKWAVQWDLTHPKAAP